MGHSYDVLAMGRSSIDLYANEIGAPFAEVKSFNAYVGGSPTNICVGARRLGLRTALLTAVGEDLVGDFVLNFLTREGIAVEFSPRKAGRRTSAFMLAIQPPDKFPIVPYRDNCADLELTTGDVRAAPVAASRALLVTGSGLSRQPSRDATLFAAETARANGNRVLLDLDMRAELWPDMRAYAAGIRSILPLTDVVIGTFEEVAAATTRDGEAAHTETMAAATATIAATTESAATTTAQESPDSFGGVLRDGVQELLGAGSAEAVVVKRGARSTVVFLRGGETVEAATFPVEVLNVLGAGDAFAGGFLYGYLKGWGWQQSARMGNACGAIVVTRHGCANFMPYEPEALAFIQERGGF
ncbi:MAG TPA: 5-dehydro-2-deoxygluconokinase [Pyrinomonadaceae bacterium]|jgi:5-dehydro-2-deoxygluconokinase|nr:5-dehydro-2-deoxygluconokinase [Pyrinomonadaceae bacterium]